jgi:hypothetical protein
MKNVREVVKEYRQRYLASDSPSYLSLEVLDAELQKGLSLEQRAALLQIRGEVLGVLYDEVLAQWLTDNNIPEEYWDEYYYDGTEIRRRE